MSEKKTKIKKRNFSRNDTALVTLVAYKIAFVFCAQIDQDVNRRFISLSTFLEPSSHRCRHLQLVQGKRTFLRKETLKKNIQVKSIID